MLDTDGRHLLVEYWGCDAGVLNDLSAIEALMKRAAREAGAHLVASVFHPFSPQGVSGVVVVEESHLSIHTWPETGYAAVDFYTCGECRPERAHEVLREALRPTRSEVMRVKRGRGPEAPSMEPIDHWSETDRGAHRREDGAALEDAAEEPSRPEVVAIVHTVAAA